jgi:hypothetical protein
MANTKNSNPTTAYLTKSIGGGGKSSVVKGGSGEMFAGGVKQTNAHNPGLSNPYKLTNKGSSSRKM